MTMTKHDSDCTCTNCQQERSQQNAQFQNAVNQREYAQTMEKIEDQLHKKENDQ